VGFKSLLDARTGWGDEMNIAIIMIKVGGLLIVSTVLGMIIYEIRHNPGRVSPFHYMMLVLGFTLILLVLFRG